MLQSLQPCHSCQLRWPTGPIPKPLVHLNHSVYYPALAVMAVIRIHTVTWHVVRGDSVFQLYTLIFCVCKANVPHVTQWFPLSLFSPSLALQALSLQDRYRHHPPLLHSNSWLHNGNRVSVLPTHQAIAEEYLVPLCLQVQEILQVLLMEVRWNEPSIKQTRFIWNCYNRGLGETLLRHEHETPLFPSFKHH